MNEIKIYGSEADYSVLESAFKENSIPYKRQHRMYRQAEAGSSDFLVITLATIHAVTIIICGYIKFGKRKLKITDGHQTVEAEHYTQKQMDETMKTATAIYFEPKKKAPKKRKAR